MINEPRTIIKVKGQCPHCEKEFQINEYIFLDGTCEGMIIKSKDSGKSYK